LFNSHKFLLLIDSLITQFDNRFNDFRKYVSQLNPFINSFIFVYNFNNFIRNEVIMLRQNLNLKELFKSTNINDFYSRLPQRVHFEETKCF